MVARKSAPKKAVAPKELTASKKLDAVGIDVICERVADAEFYDVIAKSYGVARGSLMAWLARQPDAYAHAREARADKLAEDILEIADDSSHDVIVDEGGNVKINGEFVQRSRLRVDSRKWLASKMFPKKDGDVTRLEGSKENPVEANVNVAVVVDWFGLRAKVVGKNNPEK